jgi:hypothetical protein
MNVGRELENLPGNEEYLVRHIKDKRREPDINEKNFIKSTRY